jgi:hypothetical protein
MIITSILFITIIFTIVMIIITAIVTIIITAIIVIIFIITAIVTIIITAIIILIINVTMSIIFGNSGLLASKDSKKIVRTYNKVARTLIAFEYLWYEAWCRLLRQDYMLH